MAAAAAAATDIHHDLDAAQAHAVGFVASVLDGSTHLPPGDTAVRLMCHAAAIERDVARLTAAAAAATAAQDVAGRASAQRALAALMASPHRWLDVPTTRCSAPPAVFWSLCSRLDSERYIRAEVIGWAVRAALALRFVAVDGGTAEGTRMERADAIGDGTVDVSVCRLDRACIVGAGGVGWEAPLPLLVGGMRAAAICDVLLDLPPCYGLDVAAVGTDGKPAVWSACDIAHVPLATRLLHASPPDVLNATGTGIDDAARGVQPFLPLLHVLLQALRVAPNDDPLPSEHVLGVVRVCCSERVCPCDGSGLDPLLPTSAAAAAAAATAAAAAADPGAYPYRFVGADAEALGPVTTAEAIALTAPADHDRSARATHRREACALVAGAVERVTTYARGFAPALRAALSECAVAMPAPLQAIVSGYALHLPHAATA